MGLFVLFILGASSIRTKEYNEPSSGKPFLLFLFEVYYLR